MYIVMRCSLLMFKVDGLRGWDACTCAGAREAWRYLHLHSEEQVRYKLTKCAWRGLLTSSSVALVDWAWIVTDVELVLTRSTSLTQLDD